MRGGTIFGPIPSLTFAATACTPPPSFDEDGDQESTMGNSDRQLLLQAAGTEERDGKRVPTPSSPEQDV
jgi:hypothetical protein